MQQNLYSIYYWKLMNDVIKCKKLANEFCRISMSSIDIKLQHFLYVINMFLLCTNILYIRDNQLYNFEKVYLLGALNLSNCNIKTFIELQIVTKTDIADFYENAILSFHKEISSSFD